VVEGLLTNTNHDAISLDMKAVGKKSDPESRQIAFEEINEAYVTIQFGKLK
jgi:hypothetical protein